MKRVEKCLCILLIVLFLFSCSSGILSRDTPLSCPDQKDNHIEETGILDSAEYEKHVEKESEKDTKVSFLATGDNLLHSSLICDASVNAGGKNTLNTEGPFDFMPIYANIAEAVASADLAFINQETPLAGNAYPYKGYPRFNGPFAAGEALIATGFDIVNIATNHMLDVSEGGLEGSITFWENQPVTLIGGYRNRDDFDNIRLVTCNGISIALLAYTTFINYSTSLPEGSAYIVPYAKKETIRRQTALAHKLADVVIVSVHWGKEYKGDSWGETNHFPINSSQQKITDILLSCNVDVLIGHHPHVIQSIEKKQRADGKETLVINSLGNLVSTMECMKNMVGGLFTFDIVRNNKEIRIENVLFIPTITHYNKSYRKITLHYLENYAHEQLKDHGALDSSKRTKEDLVKMVLDNIDTSYLPAYYQNPANYKNS